MSSEKCYNVVIVGAGVVGLSTAVRLQNVLGNKCKVTIIADKFFEETTSYGAAGIFKPPVEKIPGVSDEKIRKWLKDGWEHYSSLATGPLCDQSGIVIISGYTLFDEPLKRPLFADYIYEFHECDKKELAIFPGSTYSCGWHMTTVLIECRRYLPFLMKSFKENGGRIIKKRIGSLDEVNSVYNPDFIINCAGLGNQHLENDKNLYFTRGYVVRVNAPWVKKFVQYGDGFYIFPTRDSVVLGGTKQVNDGHTKPRKEERNLIFSNASNMIPSIKDAQLIEEWVGQRPMRTPLRLEAEMKQYKNQDQQTKSVWVVHNYGHGQVGVALSWGTAVSVCDVIQDILLKELTAKL